MNDLPLWAIALFAVGAIALLAKLAWIVWYLFLWKGPKDDDYSDDDYRGF